MNDVQHLERRLKSSTGRSIQKMESYSEPSRGSRPCSRKKSAESIIAAIGVGVHRFPLDHGLPYCQRRMHLQRLCADYFDGLNEQYPVQNRHVRLPYNTSKEPLPSLAVRVYAVLTCFGNPNSADRSYLS